MSYPLDAAIKTAEQMISGRQLNLSAQADARHILQEVKEDVENYPRFDPRLTDKTTLIAYTLISCACSIIEHETGADTLSAYSYLERAGKILNDTFKNNTIDTANRVYNLLVAGMALFAAKQFSRAYIAINGINAGFAVGSLVSSFIKKDFKELNKLASGVFFAEQPTATDILIFNEWVIEHETARCFMIVSDYVLSGKVSSLSEVDVIIRQLVEISADKGLTFYWMILRLLRIIMKSFGSNSLWTTVPPTIPGGDITDKYIRLLGSLKPPVTELWPSQLDSLKAALGKNNGAVINLRTSGGKTRVAELAILQALTTNPFSKILYLAPFRSLAFEIEHALGKVFSPLGFEVTHLYGNATVNLSDFDLIKSSNIIVATPEKAKALIRGGSNIENELSLIVVDEGHLLGVSERFIRNEMFLTHIKSFAEKNDIRIVLLSAILPNADELAEWIASDPALVAKSDWKPSLERKGYLYWTGKGVDLQWLSDEKPFNRNFIKCQKLGFTKRQNVFPHDKKEAVAATAVKLSQNGTVMIFSARANSIKGLAESVMLALGSNPPDFPWDKMVWTLFESVCIEELGQDDIILEAARKGVICHSNRLTPLVRIAMERLMRSTPPLIIIASTTLGQGVNIGISTVIVHSPYISQESIPNGDFWNICGRAGRAFSDSEGKILYAIDMHETKSRSQWQIRKDKQLAEGYFNGSIDRVKSGLLVALNAMLRFATQAGVSYELLIETVANNFIGDELSTDKVEKYQYLFGFIDDELLAMHEENTDEDDNVEWVDEVFRHSLALLQASEDERDTLIQLLKARTIAIKTETKSKPERKRVIATGLPVSVAKPIIRDLDYFKQLADNIDDTSSVISSIEDWFEKHAEALLDGRDFPPKDTLNLIRESWISGTKLSELKTLFSVEKEAEKALGIIKDFYAFTLPWLIHAVARSFDQETEADVISFYTRLAQSVELGLPDETSANIFLAGVRSRNAAVELAQIDSFIGQSIPNIKRTFAEGLDADIALSEEARVWLDALKESYVSRRIKSVKFRRFTIKIDDLPDKLYLRETEDAFYLSSADGRFQLSVEPTEDLPFDMLSGYLGLYFERSRELWEIKSYNPQIKVVPM